MGKKFLLLVMMLGAVLGASAQEKNIFGVKAGVNIADMTWKANGISVTMGNKTGYYVAFTYERLITNSLPLYFETGVDFASFGTNGDIEMVASSSPTSYEVTTHYLQVPVMLNYHFMVNGDFGVIPRVGVNLGVGLTGEDKVSGQVGDMILTPDQSLGNEEIFDDDGLKRFDLGLGVGVDFMYKRVTLGVMYNAGLVNISNLDGASIKNKAWTVALGYKF